LSHPNGGPYVFVAERPAGGGLETYPVLRADDAASFHAPAPAEIDKPFTREHWGVLEMHLVDPDGRHISVQAPLPDGVTAPQGHD
jgi:hypothetical protein